MQKYLILFILCLTNLFALPIQEHRLDPLCLKCLLSEFQIPLDGDIVLETQKRWLRKPGQERWEIAELSPEQREFVLRWAMEQRLFIPYKPLLRNYDQALILGATTSRMQMRLDYLKQLWNEGVRFSEIVWLTGDRPLDSRVDGFLDRCKNESEAAHIVWDEADLPEAMRGIPVRFVAAPMLGNVRPTTQDTIHAWLKTASQPSATVLFVSNQPFCGYQFAVIKTVMPTSFLFDVVGPGADLTNCSAAVILDTIARWIYIESNRF